VRDVDVAAPVMPARARQRGPQQDGIDARAGIEQGYVDWPARAVERRALAAELRVPDRALAAEIAKRRDGEKVKSRECRGFTHCKKRAHGGRMQQAARVFESYKVAAVPAGQLHPVQARYDDSSR